MRYGKHKRSRWSTVCSIVLSVERRINKYTLPRRGFGPEELATYLLSEHKHNLCEGEITTLKKILGDSK